MNFGKNQLKRCKYGWMLFGGPYVGKCFELYGEYSEEEVSIIRAFVRNGDTALDIGANIGDLTLPMALCAGDTGRVYAVESHSETFNVLCANLALNQITNTKPVNAFIADKEDTETAGAWGKHGYVSINFPPPVIPIDAFNLDACRFIKIDVDGKELEVLKSATATIARTRPVIYLENDVRDKSRALLDHLFQSDYLLYWHPAPIFRPDNFFGNPVNHWPQNVISLMVLCLPKEKYKDLALPMKKISSPDDWWE
ncbi:MAG: FkbM family methyltransferase [Acidobacteriota bacterium]